MRCCNCSKFFVANILVFAFNILLYVHIARHPQFSLLSNSDNGLTTASPTTSRIVDCPYNWKAPEIAAFASPLDAKDRYLLDRTFRKFVEAVESVNLTYFIIGGTLIGSLRHHGPIPWDDDVDVMLNASDISKAKDVLASYDPDFGLHVRKAKSGITFWKYFPMNGRKLRSYPMYRTPFVDIWFFYENETHIWNADRSWNRVGTSPKSKIFPLTRRPFGELLLPAPCNGLVALGSHIDISMCYSRYYNHLLEDWIRSRFKLPCDRLANIHPFVTRSSVANESSHSVKETLKLGKWAIREIMVDEFC